MSFELTLNEGAYLVRLARHAITDYLEFKMTIPVPIDVEEKMLRKCGVFVTLNDVRRSVEELRGCIGYPTPKLPLVEATIDAAISAATRDPRFPPVEKNELASISIEVSILTPPSLIRVKNPKEYPHQVEIGRDGLILEHGWSKGLLLPQVPVEWKWDSEEFLGHCCMKAGLPPEAWVLPETKIYKFSCIIFKELTPCGEIVRLNLSDKKTK
ncbi:TIGR00296 family protein [Candidatus Bathyarchaeota archaeon]|nr:TIGR00296 family protein [Candidatus Bathyarchaeota archaeon]